MIETDTTDPAAFVRDLTCRPLFHRAGTAWFCLGDTCRSLGFAIDHARQSLAPDVTLDQPEEHPECVAVSTVGLLQLLIVSNVPEAANWRADFYRPVPKLAAIAPLVQAADGLGLLG